MINRQVPQSADFMGAQIELGDEIFDHVEKPKHPH